MTSRHTPRAVARVLLSVTTLLGLLTMNMTLLPSARAASTPPTYELMWGSTGTGNGQFRDPRDLAVDSQGHVYVADSTNLRVQKFDRFGTFIHAWSSASAPSDTFQPIGIVVDTADHVYVSDGQNGRVLKFDGDGVWLGTWGAGQMSGPAGMAFDAQGTLYVVDNYANRVHTFDSTGTYLTSWGTAGSAAGQLLAPFGITIDATGNVYVAEQINNRIQKFSSAGTSLAIWNTYSGVADIAVDRAGTFYATNTGNHRIVMLNGTGGWVGAWGSLGTGANEFNSPGSLTIGSDNTLYVSEGGNNRVQKFSIAIPNTAPTTPGTPTLTTGSAAANRGVFDLTWMAASDNQGDAITYELQQQDANDPVFSTAATVTTNGYSVTADAPAAEGRWTFRVRASDGTLQSDYSGTSSTIIVDQTAPAAPTASYSKTPEYIAGGTAWYKDSVTVSYVASADPALLDGSAGSGIDPTSYPTSQVLGTNGTNLYSVTVKDLAGNESAPTSGSVKVDTLKPVVSVTCPATAVRLKSKATASWTATDPGASSGNGSGVVAGFATGSIQLNTSSVGLKTAVVPAAASKDNVGYGSDAATCSYQVVKR